MLLTALHRLSGVSGVVICIGCAFELRRRFREHARRSP